jgi:hypothetical protein
LRSSADFPPSTSPSCAHIDYTSDTSDIIKPPGKRWKDHHLKLNKAELGFWDIWTGLPVKTPPSTHFAIARLRGLRHEVFILGWRGTFPREGSSFKDGRTNDATWDEDSKLCAIPFWASAKPPK